MNKLKKENERLRNEINLLKQKSGENEKKGLLFKSKFEWVYTHSNRSSSICSESDEIFLDEFSALKYLFQQFRMNLDKNWKEFDLDAYNEDMERHLEQAGWGNASLDHNFVAMGTITAFDPNDDQLVCSPISLKYEELKKGALWLELEVDALKNLRDDFLQLFESQKFADEEIKGIKFHSTWVEKRLSVSSKTLKKKLSAVSKKDLKTFFKWLYTGWIHVPQGFDDYFQKENHIKKIRKIIVPILKKFKLKGMETQNKWMKDLEELYLSRKDSAEFNIVLKKKNKEEKNKKTGKSKRKKNKKNKKEEEEENTLENKETQGKNKFPIHKFILLARSGLYRSYFSSIKATTGNNISDYSLHSNKFWEYFIQFLYLGKVPNQKNMKIYQEIIDTNDYYQLSNETILTKMFKKHKKWKHFLNQQTIKKTKKVSDEFCSKFSRIEKNDEYLQITNW
ncbi:td and poz domain-containing protein [Anaeramoeba flamelloides]|uniref:Td and poz domain-containing protein n=1 Tax=Anaeramoeba flamelloides TaxID=1746091 RepID=A0ABQ8YMC7_9EUKA|nr:td and poz domain-containing protein [Anaeramoeba flamelloides]